MGITGLTVSTSGWAFIDRSGQILGCRHVQFGICDSRTVGARSGRVVARPYVGGLLIRRCCASQPTA
jgi:hypothetical protein